MTAGRKIKIGIVGASGYTGADLVRLATAHPRLEVAALSARTDAGRPMGEVFAHLASCDLPRLVAPDDLDMSTLDVLFCALPHGTAQALIAGALSNAPDLTIIDLSADFRLRDPARYEQWYGKPHEAPELQSSAVYGLTEHCRSALEGARLIACPGCYPTAVLLALLPLIKARTVATDEIIIDAKSGVSGAGRTARQGTLFCEVGEGVKAYGLSGHRHIAELEQELGLAAGARVQVSFTPHLVPMSRGELVTCYVRCKKGQTPPDLRNVLLDAYKNAPFVHVLGGETVPATQQVRGANLCNMNVFPDHIDGRAIVIAAIDNLVKGSAGQAIQNLNVALGLEETLGLHQAPLFP